MWKFPNSVDIWVVYWAWAVHNVAADNPVINPAGTSVHYNLDDPASKYFYLHITRGSIASFHMMVQMSRLREINNQVLSNKLFSSNQNALMDCQIDATHCSWALVFGRSFIGFKTEIERESIRNPFWIRTVGKNRAPRRNPE